MIALAIIGILSAIAYPSYAQFVIRSDRAEARSTMMRVSQILERRFTEQAQYPTVAQFESLVGITSGSSLFSSTEDPTKGRYQISYEPGAAPALSYTLTATHVSSSDTDCGNLTLNNLGVRGRTGTEWSVNDCWRR